MFAHAMLQVARKEYIQHFRTKRLFVVAGLLLAIMVLATIVGPGLWVDQERDRGATEQDLADFQPNPTLMVYLGAPLIGGYMFIQLVAIILTSDSVCSEWQNRTIFLLLSKPVPRSAFLLGKYLGTVGALSTVIVAIVGGDYLAMTLVLPEGQSGDVLGFLGALGVLLLGAASFSAFSLFMSTLTRSTVMSTLAGLGAWLIVFPLVGSVGFLMAVSDKEFREAGEYDYDAVFKTCGEDPQYFYLPDQTDEERAAARATYAACEAPFQQAYEKYYTDRGLVWFDDEARAQACQDMENAEQEVFDANSDNMSQAERDAFWDGRPSRACRTAYYDDYDSWEDERTRLLLGKYDEPRVDWSRYLSPTATMSIADDLLRGNRTEGLFEDISLSPQTILSGADTTATHPVLAVFALAASIGVYLGAGMLIVRRRDFE